MKAQNAKVRPADEKVDTSRANISRRSFTKAGIVTPILLSAVNRPAWAEVANCSFGQALSGNLSQRPAGSTCDQDSPSSVNPSFYESNGNWSVYGVEALSGLPFNDTLSGGGPSIGGVFGSPRVTVTGPNNDDPTLRQMIEKTNHSNIKFPNTTILPVGADEDDVTNHYIAAFLNAMSPDLVFPFAAFQIVADWGVWNLYTTLAAIQSGSPELTVLQVNATIDFYN
ncbi:MAG: hypothetical protein ACU836_08075 [Gammaproteobacteria bacterium]